METLSGNFRSRLKLLPLKILCCVGSSLINKKKSSMKVPREPGIQYIITNKKVFSYISSTTENTSKTPRISITIILNNQVVKRNYTQKNHAIQLVNSFLIHNSTTKLFPRHYILQNNDHSNFGKIHIQKI